MNRCVHLTKLDRRRVRPGQPPWPVLATMLAAIAWVQVRPAPATAQVAAGPPQDTAGALPVDTPRAPVPPTDQVGRQVYRQAVTTAGPKILVSIEQRRLWYIVGRDTLMNAPVAVGMGKDFEFQGRHYHFKTPKGRRTVLRKRQDPRWIVPVWHYYERAAANDLQVVRLQRGVNVQLSDGSYLTIVGQQVGRVNQFGNFWPITPGNEIMFDGKVFIPPRDTDQRSVPDALGPFALDTGDGYLIHGTHIYNEDSIGRAVSHGCVRMRNEDLVRLYPLVRVGTPVFVF